MTDNLRPDELDALKRVGKIHGPAGQRALRRRFLVEVDLETPGLPANEREKRAYDRYRAYMTELAHSSVVARRAK